MEMTKEELAWSMCGAAGVDYSYNQESEICCHLWLMSILIHFDGEVW